MIPRTIFSIENQMQVIPRRETWEKKRKKRKKQTRFSLFFISFHVLLFSHLFLFPFIFSHFFTFLFVFSHLFSCPFIFSHFFTFLYIFSHVFEFCAFFSLEKTIAKLDLLQFDTLFSFAEHCIWCLNVFWGSTGSFQLCHRQPPFVRTFFQEEWPKVRGFQIKTKVKNDHPCPMLFPTLFDSLHCSSIVTKLSKRLVVPQLLANARQDIVAVIFQSKAQ